ncbi:MAG: hypothetical protein FJY88_00690 [Candidatus Eisenbacteria bacterium]|nr:hypothetical protein [Candidatus Eisenbacteria bacterium]
MTAATPSGRSFWVGIALLLSGVAFLAFRGGSAVTAVLDAGRGSHQKSLPVAAGVSKTPAGWAQRDSLLAAARLGDRDPFRPPTAPRGEVARDRARKPDDGDAPSIGALLFDNINPAVQIRVGGETSGWLREGEEFRGWVVDDIRPTSVKISRGAETVVLPSS